MTNSNTPLYRAAQIREAESHAFTDHGLDSLQLMRQAGQAVFEQIRQHWPEASRITVCCGTGNNGGDGYVVARLALQAGMQVRLQAVGDVTALQNDALASSREFVAAGGRIDDADGNFDDSELIVDALLGTGLNRPVDGEYANLIKAINADRRPVVAIDVPSGLHADTGAVMGAAIKANLCVTLIGLKSGLFTGDALEYRGKLVLASLNFPDDVLNRFQPHARIFDAASKLAKRSRNAHKGDFGHLLVVGGNLGYSGAVRLAAEAAVRSGVGLVSVATRTQHAGLINIGRPELMCHGVESASQLQELLARADAVVIGPGLAQDDWARQLLEQVLASQLPLVVDADALNLLAKKPVKRDNWLLTPHPGEAARLLNSPTTEINADRYEAVAALQRSFDGVCLLKGAGTLVSDGEMTTVNITGNPGMASGGMGDVLAGVCGALIVQGLPLAEAARLATLVHGKAADLVAKQSGERGLLASDLMPTIRSLLN